MVLGFGMTSGYVFQYIGAKIAPEVDTIAPVLRRVTMDKDGTKQSGSTSITSDDIAVGIYSITHNFGTTNYSAVITASTGSTSGIGVLTEKNTNGCTFEMRNLGGALVDLGSEVILAKDVI